MKAVVAAGLLAAVALCAGSAAASTRTGLRGRVCRGPVPAAGQRTCVPQRLTFLLVGGGRRYTVRSSAAGYYRVALRAGLYRASVPVRSIGTPPRLRPQWVRVRAGECRHVDLFFERRPLP